MKTEEQNKDWPAWFYGPDGKSDVFENEADVPAGWADHPAKVKNGAGPVPNTPRPDHQPNANDGDPNAEIDTDGWPWNEEFHAATKTQTQSGQWRLKVGVTRPAPKAGFPKVDGKPLDL